MSTRSLCDWRWRQPRLDAVVSAEYTLTEVSSR
jgi:hypothetical protein